VAAISKAQGVPSVTTVKPELSPHQKNNVLMPDIIADKWKAITPTQTRDGEQLNNVPLAEISLEYGLKTINNRAYVNGQNKCLVEVYEMRFPSGAYGFFSFTQSRLSQNQQQFQAGRFLIRIQGLSNTKKVESGFVNELAKHFKATEAQTPPLVDQLPQLGKASINKIYLSGPKALASNENFSFLAPGLNFEGGTDAVSTEYQLEYETMALLLVEFHTPQLASDGYEKLELQIAALDPERKLRTSLTRIGNYVVVTTGVTEQQARSIVGEIKYAPKVYWEGDKYSAIPLEFRPPDQVAIQEANETAAILLRTFYWIGSMLLLAIAFGLIAGCSYFYWRKFQRRKSGINDLFGDAGGTIRLQLDAKLVDSDEAKLLN
jgi:hypothetical protein